MASNAIGGTAYLKIDGTQYKMRGNWKVAPNAVMRKGVAGMDGTHGYSESYQVQYAEGDISDAGGLSIQALQNLTNNTVTLALVNGKTYVVVNAWYASPGELDVVQGQTTVRFEGMDVEEMLASGS
jgi:hypothetical protein